MDPYDETFRTWNKVASLYEEKFMDLVIYDESYSLFCDRLKTNAHALDIGCGPGNITRFLLNKRPDLHIDGTDVAPAMIELAKKNNPAANFMVLDSRNITELASKYDGIICGFCIPYLSSSDVKKLISDSLNMLNDGGIFYLSFVEGDPGKSGFVSGSSGDRTYFYYHELDELRQQLRDAGFEKAEVLKVDYRRSETVIEIHTVLIVGEPF